MRRGTTPTLSLTVNDVDLTLFRSIYITFRQPTANVQYVLDETCSNVRIEKHRILIKLSQEQTLTFTAGPVLVQFRAITYNDVAVASDVSSFSLGDVLLDGVIG